MPIPLATKRISVTIERALIDEIKELVGKKTLSVVVTEALRSEARRLGMLAYLEEREREKPISPKGRAAGERLWKTLVLAFSPEKPKRSRKQKKLPAARSKKR